MDGTATDLEPDDDVGAVEEYMGVVLGQEVGNMAVADDTAVGPIMTNVAADVNVTVRADEWSE